VLDDCRRTAVLSLPLPQVTACSYLYQQPQYYYKCKLLQLQWVRGDNSLRWVRRQAAAVTKAAATAAAAATAVV
jgi:hypothetical protein